MSAGRSRTRVVTRLHVICKKLRAGPRYYVYAWRGGPQIHVQDGTKPTITPELMDQARAARLQERAGQSGEFDRLIDEYLASPEFARLAKVTKDDYRRWLTRISERFGNAPLAVMSDYRVRKDILIWRDKWADQPRAADRAVGTLSTVLGWGARRGMLATNIALEIGTIHRVNHADEIWEERHWQAVKDIPQHILNVLHLGQMTGLRLGDLLSLNWSHVSENAIVIVTSKRKVRAAIPLHRDLRALLNGLPRTEGTVLTNSKGSAWTVSGFKSSWSKVRPKDFDRRIHDLRGTCATWLAIKGLTDNEIATVLGWKPGRVAEIRVRYVDQARTVISLAERLNG